MLDREPGHVHLWLDFETTGLDPKIDSVLEVGWTFTDDDLRQLTPLRQRFCLLTPECGEADDDEYDRKPRRTDDTLAALKNFNPALPGHWKRVDGFVREMHDSSGLYDDWMAARHSLRMLTEPRDLERLLMEDMNLLGFDHVAGDRLVLSGAGVSHFDLRVLQVHLPRLFPVNPTKVDALAYWQHDTSVAWRTIGKGNEEIIRSCVPELRNLTPGGWEWAIFEADAGSDPSARHLVHQRAEGFRVFRRDNVVPHRAADDVVDALIDGRILRNMVDLLTPGVTRG